MKNSNFPKLSSYEIAKNFEKARLSSRKRYAKILHKPGAEFNQVFNFMLEESYMQPHLHPSVEKIEKMYLVQGNFAVLFFNEDGKVENVSLLEKGGCENIEIPAFKWHTYVILTENVISYETMIGKFEPQTWKTLADWAPGENTPESESYLALLKQHSIRKFV